MWTNVADADLVLLVGEAGRPRTFDERQIADRCSAAIWALNKCDLQACNQVESGDAIHVSALTGAGLDVLVEAIVQRLVPAPPAPGTAVPFSRRQVEALSAARDALARNAIAEAAAVLRRLAPDLTDY
jgi:tRNA U34 5-carboxymethylaminomethyl modifying GTPase MnmE/TrmE